MLEVLGITNFQGNRKLVIEFDPFLTTLVGPNGAGKSSAVRALRWLCLNDTSGDSIISWGRKEAVVTAGVDGRVIVRGRGQSKNVYSLDKKVFKAFGAGNVPEEVANNLNVSQDNFQGQLDQPFWLLESAGQVAKHLNKVVNLGVIDSSLKYVAGEVRKRTAALAVNWSRLKEAKKNLKKLSWVPDFVADLERVERLDKKLKVRQKQVLRLSRTLKDVRACAREESSIGAKVKAGELVLEAGVALLERMGRAEWLASILTQIRALEKEPTPVLPTPRQVARMGRYLHKIESLKSKADSLQRLLEEVKSAEEELCQAERKTSRSVTRLAKMSKGRCPVCGRTRKNPS